MQKEIHCHCVLEERNLAVGLFSFYGKRRVILGIVGGYRKNLYFPLSLCQIVFKTFSTRFSIC